MTPTREELLEARIAYLSDWLEKAEVGHRTAMMEADTARATAEMLRRRGCCKEDGGEDANTSD